MNRARAVAVLALVLAAACATPSLTAADHAEVRATLDAVKASDFPELAGVEVELSTFHDDSAFFQSNFDVWAALWGERRYTVYANPRAFAAGVPRDGLRGVLAHELAHTVDYQRRDRLGLVGLLPVLLLDDANRRFERWTDLQAVARGHGPSLLVYRRWQRTVLTPEQWEQKRFAYYGPDELAVLIDVRGRCPHVFYRLLENPPFELRQITTHCP